MRRKCNKYGLFLTTALGAALLLGAGEASANIVYAVDQTIGAGSVVGSVTTDGNTGPLSASDFLSWNLQLNGAGASFTITNLDSGAAVYEQGSDVNATATAITFDFSAADNGFLVFQDGLFGGNHYWCNAASASACFQGKTVTPGSVLDGTAIHVAETGVQIIAGSAATVPEPASWTLMLIGFGGLGYAGFRQRRLTARMASIA
jgi:hypothetical protein